MSALESIKIEDIAKEIILRAKKDSHLTFYGAEISVKPFLFIYPRSEHPISKQELVEMIQNKLEELIQVKIKKDLPLTKKLIDEMREVIKDSLAEYAYEKADRLGIKGKEREKFVETVLEKAIQILESDAKDA